MDIINTSTNLHNLYLLAIIKANCHFNYRINRDGVIKVADFGLTEDMYAANYHRSDRSKSGNDERVPIRWMAPESIESDLYSENTDVVST